MYKAVKKHYTFATTINTILSVVYFDKGFQRTPGYSRKSMQLVFRCDALSVIDRNRRADLYTQEQYKLDKVQ